MQAPSANHIDVVIATDGSELADRAVAAGAGVARAHGARTMLGYVRPSLGTEADFSPSVAMPVQIPSTARAVARAGGRGS